MMRHHKGDSMPDALSELIAHWHIPSLQAWWVLFKRSGTSIRQIILGAIHDSIALNGELFVDKENSLKVGRPRKYTTEEQKKAANAAAAKSYRERQRQKRDDWRDLKKHPQSSIIDLSCLAPSWRIMPK